MADHDEKKKRRYAVIGISSFLLVAMVIAVTIGTNLEIDDADTGSAKNERLTASMKAIKSICAPTQYKKTCEDNLRANAGNTTDPKELIRVVFNVTMKYINEAAKRSTTLNQLNQDPRTHVALRQCKELMHYSVGELKKSFDHMGSLDVTKIDEILVNMKIWLSAAITNQQTCLDGFQDTTGDAGEKMKHGLKTSMMLTHDVLAIVHEISKAFNQINGADRSSRRLLSAEDLPVLGHDEIDVPEWVNPATRKLLSAPPSTLKPDIVVAKDGSGDFLTINEAIAEVPKRSNKTIIMYIKEGVYKEIVEVKRSMTNLMIIGDGSKKTIITGDLSYSKNLTTYRTATFAASGDNFIAKNIGFENTAGAIRHQAVALRVMADMAIFYNCSIDAYQDTLYAHTKRQFYRDTVISGTIDFIFGNAVAAFQNCTLLVRKPLPNQQCPITAQGSNDPHEPTGFVFQGCTIDGEPEYLAVQKTSRSFLGRPWKPFSKTVIMNSYIPDFVDGTGWMPWNATAGLDTCFYAEYENEGPGAAKINRVKWLGIKELTEEQIIPFTPGNFLRADDWIKASGVPYTSGMLGNTIIRQRGSAPSPAPDRVTKSPSPSPSPSPSSMSAPAPVPSPPRQKPSFLFPSTWFLH
ncbi:putative pectinesterase/pectinesterase inhibitor 28 [Carica papaya]|uniref:putative pectinesterase/pectinesterase inhibitor 28 n=1 Tax=Carica papaya TaxID=3649 RepID=UPI000B8CC0FB|nr:putative pectinesterase/pectinesterase inhibitor 28 [Carica papaya]